MFSFSLSIFGCQMNYADAEIITASLQKIGGQKIPLSPQSDVIIVVSCGVRQGAEERIINWTQKLRQKNSAAIIILTGCLSHRVDIQERLAFTNIFFTPINRWSEQIKKLTTIFQPEITSNGSCQDDFYSIKADYSSHYRAYLPIVTGCNNFCAYCVVPYARGPEISRSPELLLAEITKLIKKGYKEIFLLGQNVNSYQGLDQKKQKWNFARLLRAINAIPGNFWIRFLSSHPKDLDQNFIETLQNCPKISRQLHLPIQSGSNRILAKMNRRYTREDYFEIIKQIRASIPNIILSTDILVGFPNESEADFQDSLTLVKKVGFEKLYALKYSPRPETAAYLYPDNVSTKTKKKRQQILDQTWQKIAEKQNQKYLNREIIILIDKIQKKADQKWIIGKNLDNKDVIGVISNKTKTPKIGQWAKIKIEQTGSLGLRGKFISAF